MNKIFTLIFLLGSTALFAHAPDTVVTVTGTIVSQDDNSPVAGVVEYRKLPYGDEIGKISSNAQGEYTIYLHGNSNYSFKVSSDGYFAHTEQLHTGAMAMDKDIALSSGGAGHVFRLDNLIFALGDDQITEASYAELDGLVERLNESPGMVIQLEGHTDVRGDAAQNLALSQDRVNSVKAYLESKGISGDRILTKAFGGTQPFSTEDSDEARAQNRRVEVRIIKAN